MPDKKLLDWLNTSHDNEMPLGDTYAEGTPDYSVINPIPSYGDNLVSGDDLSSSGNVFKSPSDIAKGMGLSPVDEKQRLEDLQRKQNYYNLAKGISALGSAIAGAYGATIADPGQDNTNARIEAYRQHILDMVAADKRRVALAKWRQKVAQDLADQRWKYYNKANKDRLNTQAGIAAMNNATRRQIAEEKQRWNNYYHSPDYVKMIEGIKASIRTGLSEQQAKNEFIKQAILHGSTREAALAAWEGAFPPYPKDAYKGNGLVDISNSNMNEKVDNEFGKLAPDIERIINIAEKRNELPNSISALYSKAAYNGLSTSDKRTLMAWYEDYAKSNPSVMPFAPGTETFNSANKWNNYLVPNQ